MAINNTLGQIGGILPVPNYLGGKPKSNLLGIGQSAFLKRGQDSPMAGATTMPNPQGAGNLSSIATPAQLQAIKSGTIGQPIQPSVPPQGVSAPQPPTQSQGTPNVQTYGPGGSGLSPEQIAAANAAEDKRVAAGTPNIIQPNNPNNPPAGDVNPAASLTLGGLVPQLLRNAGQNPAVMKAQQELQDLRNARATAVNQIQGAPGLGLQESSGQQGLLENLFATKEKAAIENLTNAQQEQQIQQGALGTAVGAVAPQLGQIGQVPFTPATGEQGNILGTTGGGGTALNPLNNISSIAQQVISGQISPQQGYAMGGSVSNFQGALNAELQKQKPGFDTAQAQGAYDAKQANVQTGGTAPVTAANTVYQSAFNEYQNLQQSVQNVDSFGTLLTSGMTDKNGNVINPSDLKFANRTIADIRNMLSSSQQGQFDSTYAALKAKVSGLLSVGGNEIPSQITSDANKILDGSAPFGTLSATLQRIQTEGNILLNTQAQKVNNALKQIQGGTQTGGQTGTSGGFTEGQTSSDKSLVFKGGKWVVNK